jgi:hypothetical protein
VIDCLSVDNKISVYGEFIQMDELEEKEILIIANANVFFLKKTM